MQKKRLQPDEPKVKSDGLLQVVANRSDKRNNLVLLSTVEPYSHITPSLSRSISIFAKYTSLFTVWFV